MENYTYGVLNSLLNVADIIDDKNDDEQNVAVGNDKQSSDEQQIPDEQSRYNNRDEKQIPDEQSLTKAQKLIVSVNDLSYDSKF